MRDSNHTRRFSRPRPTVVAVAGLTVVLVTALLLVRLILPSGDSRPAAARGLAGPGAGREGRPSPGSTPGAKLTSHTRPRIAVPPGWISTVGHLQSGPLLRTYLVEHPALGSGPMPVLIVLHGRGMTPTSIATVTDFLPVVGRAVVVYPQGYELSWNAGACCGGAQRAGVDDVAFLADLVHHVVATVPGASASQVYLVGFSNGGRMAYRMACDDPGLFAGVAAVEAVPVMTCPAPQPIPLAIVAYQDDPLLAIAPPQPPRRVEGYVEPRVDQVVASWRHADGCPVTPSVREQGTVTVSSWSGCKDDTRFQYDLYAGGSHHWPRGNPTTPSATQLIWRFFNQTG